MLQDMDLGDDWSTYPGAAMRLLTGQRLYTIVPGEHAFGNPPHALFLLFPFAVLPSGIGYLLVVVLSVLVTIWVCRRWRFGVLKTLLVISSFPMVITLYHGNLDALMVGILLLPRACHAFLALAKPQVAIGLIPRSLKLKTSWIGVSIALLLGLTFEYQSVGEFGMREFVMGPHNLWRQVSPWQYFVGAALLAWGWIKRDDRLLLMSSPFLSPYATLSNLVALAVGVAAMLNRWIVFALWAISWLYLGYR